MLAELKALLAEVSDLSAAGAVLSWDQTTYMPSGGGPARGRQLATLGRLAHEKLVDPSIGRLLDILRPYEESLPYDADDAALLRVTRRDYERSLKVPSDFVAELCLHQAASFDAWAQARPANDFPAVLPFLEKTLDLSRRYAEYFPGYEHIADPLIEDADYGMKVSTIRPVFAELRRQLVPLVQAITAQPPADDSCLRRTYREDQQLAFGAATVRQLGYDFQRGRQDKTHHPYTTTFSLGDVRITTRVRENDLSEALFSTIHEAGHAIYEQGIRQEFEATPLASGTSSGVHESQSRLWENIVGRGRPFWQHFYPKLQTAFPAQLGQTSQDTFYRAINKVWRSLIRTDADEVTYNLHVIIRFGLELDLLEGKLAVRDLAEAWRERYQSDLGVSSPDDKDGVLQDVHWYDGFIGGSFQGYTLGNIMGAQFYAAALRAQPSIPAEIAQGQFGTLHQWLVDNIYQHGRKFTAAEIVQRATCGPLSIDPYMAYLKTKYGELYSLWDGARQPRRRAAVDVYEALQEKLNRHAMGAPKREEFLEILRILFTPEEAELAAHLPFAPQRVDEIAQALGRPEAEVLRLCEQMADKTLLYSYDMRGTTLYMLFPSAPGLFEFPIMKNAVSPGSIPNVDFGRLGKLWWRYHDHGWGLEMGNSSTPAARVIPVQQAITPDLHVYAYEEVATFVNNSKYVAISECPCRVSQHNCDAPTDVCMAFGYGAKFLAERGAARLVTKEEAMATLKRAEDAGLVHCASNTRDKVEYICNCCPCCCGILGVVTRLEGAISKPESNFYSTVIADNCTVCGICVDRCPTKAITLGDVAVVDTAKCIGCGLCVSGCGFEALALVRKGNSVEPPADNRELYATLAMEKGREQFVENLTAS